MAYDPATGAPVGISSGIGQSSAVQSLVYTWDGYGNLIERQDANQSNLYETLSYDDLNRLTGSQVANSANNGPTNDYQYDAMGNITTPTIAGTGETYTYDPNHPYAVDSIVNSSGTTVYSAAYDADGDMTTRNGYPITWTVDNLPASIASAAGSSTFSYDPDGNRYYQAATFNGNGTDTTYIGGLFEVVSTSTTTEYRHNIVADGQIVAVHTIDQSGDAYTDYLHSDHLGSVDVITNDSGNVIQTMSFDAFGMRRDPTNWDYDLSQNTISTLKNYTDRGYTDQEELDSVALVDMNGRVYDPTVGRFISADPTVPDPLFSQAFNRYSYVYNSPLEYTDPSGFSNVNPATCPQATGTQCTGQLPPITVYLPIGDNGSSGTGLSGLTNCPSCVVTSSPGNGPANGSPGVNGPSPTNNAKPQPPKQKQPNWLLLAVEHAIQKYIHLSLDLTTSGQYGAGASTTASLTTTDATPTVLYTQGPPGFAATAGVDLTLGMPPQGVTTGLVLQGGDLGSVAIFVGASQAGPVFSITLGVGGGEFIGFISPGYTFQPTPYTQMGPGG